MQDLCNNLLCIVESPSRRYLRNSACGGAEECRLHLPQGSRGLDDAFVSEFNSKVSTALKARVRLNDWTALLGVRSVSDVLRILVGPGLTKPQDVSLLRKIDSGFKPSWFLWRCLPVVGFLRGSVAVAEKRPRVCGQFDSDEQRQELLLSGGVGSRSFAHWCTLRPTGY